MDSDTTFVTSRSHKLGEEAPEHTMASAIAGFEKSLAALRLDGISKPLVEVAHSHACSCSCAQAGTDINSAVAVGEDEIGLQLQSKADTIYVPRDQLQSSELPRFDSTSSMRSFMTDSIFSICTTTDTCPPSPSLSAHVAEPLHCGSWNLNSNHVLDTPRGVNTWSALRTGGKGSGSPIFSLAPSDSSEDGSSHSTCEYGSKDSSTFSSRSSVHEFSRFTDGDSDQSPSVRDDPYDLLIETVCNVVSNHFPESELRKLTVPITHYANVFLEHIARDIGDSTTFNTTPVIYQTHGSSTDTSTASIEQTPIPDSSFSHENKQEPRCEQNDSEEGDSDDDGSRPPMRTNENEAKNRVRASREALSCPFRKRNPMRFNVRLHSPCALSDFPSVSHLKRHIKAFHSASGEICPQCGSWFATLDDLDQHTAQPMCEPGHAGNRNPEDGICQADLRDLFDKKVRTWNDLWLILFPDLDGDIPCPGEVVLEASRTEICVERTKEFDPPVELDEIETRFYGTDSLDSLSQTFQQMALSPPSMSPAQLSQRALNESMEFITSTLQRCRDIHGHTSSLSREVRTQAFLERVQNLLSQPPVVQNMALSTPIGQSQLNPRYSRGSNDSGIASFAEFDIDVDTSWEPDRNCSNLGKAALLPVRSMSLSKEKNVQLGKTHFDNYIVTESRPFGFSSIQAGPALASPILTIPPLLTSCTPCSCQGMCSLCHVAEFQPLEAHVGQWPKHSASGVDLFGTEADAYPFDETRGTDAPAAWEACTTLYDAKTEYWDQNLEDHVLADADHDTPSTQPSPPDHSYSGAEFTSAREEYNSQEEDTEAQYERLVENIANLVVKSNWIGLVEDDCVPIVQYTHAYLENIRTHDDILDITGRLHVSCTTPCADSNDTDPNMGDQEASGGANGNKKRKQGSGHGNHRKKRDNDDQYPNGNGPEDFDDPEEWSGDKKRARVDDRQKLPCPYRKRNPTRFNIRKHHQCALNTFTDLALLKRHIKTFHMPTTQGPRCVRCEQCFQTKDDLKEHLRQANVCNLRTGQGELQDPEDGLSEEMYDSLTKRSKGEKVDTWDALWRLLFPMDGAVPNPHYEEPVELDEVQEKCYNEQSLSRFFQKLAHHTHEDGYRYIVKTFKKIRKASNHIYCEQRRQKDCEFLQAVRQRASVSRDSAFSNPSWGTQPAGSSLSNVFNQPDGIPPRVGSSGLYSLPDMTETSPSTGFSSNDARDAITPTSNWQQLAGASGLHDATPSPTTFFVGSNINPEPQQQAKISVQSEVHLLQEQVPIHDDDQKSIYRQDRSIPRLCHHLEMETNCEECVGELSTLFGPGDFGQYPMEQVAGDDSSSLNQDQIIWPQTALGK